MKSLNTKRRNGTAHASAGESGDQFLVPPPLETTSENSTNWQSPWYKRQLTHDFSDCCLEGNVSQRCMGYCSIHNILDGTTGIDPEACEKDFPQIVRCMADGRNHVPCCVQKQIPDLCQDMCRGEYTPFTDFLRSRVSCVHHTLSGLQCILSGVQQIPSMPMYVSADETTETTATISWSPPQKLPHMVKHYNVTFIALHSFDEDNSGLNDDNGAANTKSPASAKEFSKDTVKDSTKESKSVSKMNNSKKSSSAKERNRVLVHLVSANVTKVTITDLQPLTMYTVVVTACNEYGSSLPTESLRIFTHTSDLTTELKSGTSDKIKGPNLPDIRNCCEANGMTHRLCLDKMCDPQKTDLATLPDFMVCAPWSNITFNCLANNIDHTPCCRARGIPTACYPLCSGKVHTLDFSLFK